MSKFDRIFLGASAGLITFCLSLIFCSIWFAEAYVWLVGTLHFAPWVAHATIGLIAYVAVMLWSIRFGMWYGMFWAKRHGVFSFPIYVPSVANLPLSERWGD